MESIIEETKYILKTIEVLETEEQSRLRAVLSSAYYNVITKLWETLEETNINTIIIQTTKEQKHGNKNKNGN